MAGPSHSKASKGSRDSTIRHNDHISDPRFANIQTDPRFRLPSKKNTHVQIDKRFERMLRDEAFSSRAKVDRYGRKLPKDAGKKDLEKYYRIQEDQGDLDEDRDVESELKKADAVLGEDEISSSADESSSEEDSDQDVDEDEEVFGLLDGQEADGGGIPMGEVTSRLAVVNLDWDHIRAADLMAVFSSFVSGSSQIRKISVYPSEFGKERMEREEMEGPPKEIFAASRREDGTKREDETDEMSSAEEDDEKIKQSLLQDDTGQDFNSAKLRRYQLERLRYYYAVVVCSSSSVAQSIYETVDGTEYLTTANYFDLRFIPDDVDFSSDKPRDECTQIPDGYQPNEFVTDALQHSKVRLTWDADDGTRKEAQKRAFAASRANIDENDLKAYLGSDTSDDEGDAPEPIVVDATTNNVPEPEDSTTSPSGPVPKISKKEAERQRMRTLLGLDPEPTTSSASISKKSKPDQSAAVGDMQITFSSGLTAEPNPASIFTNSPDDKEETTVEKYVRKEKERKARRKAKAKALREDDTAPDAPTDNPIPPDSTEPQTKATEKEDLGFSDPFFADPASKPAPKTPTERKEAKHLKKSQHQQEEEASSSTQQQQRAALELLTLPSDITSTQQEGNTIQHFDINSLLRAEKSLSKRSKSKNKKRKMTERDREALKAKEQDTFEMDVGDQRFGAVYQRPEFAIDPSHPRFLGTGGMKAILEEGRRKRRREEENGSG